MKKESVFYGVIGLLVGVIVMGFVAAYSINHGYGGMMGLMGIDRSRMIGGNTDKSFIEQMIPHHESAIVMAKLAQEKSNRTEIKALANDIISSQTAEINKMRTWYREWYGGDVPKRADSGDGMSMMHGSWSEDDLNAASDFDKAFLEEMIPHHQMAVMMANMLQSGTDRQEMKTLANDIIIAQSKEIGAMRSWQVQWGYATSGRNTNSMMDMH